MTLEDTLIRIDKQQGGRFRKLIGAPRVMATEGIIRHLRACANMDVAPDVSAIREIIDDALKGEPVFKNTNNDDSENSKIPMRTHKYNKAA